MQLFRGNKHRGMVFGHHVAVLLVNLARQAGVLPTPCRDGLPLTHRQLRVTLPETGRVAYELAHAARTRCGSWNLFYFCARPGRCGSCSRPRRFQRIHGKGWVDSGPGVKSGEQPTCRTNTTSCACAGASARITGK